MEDIEEPVTTRFFLKNDYLHNRDTSLVAALDIIKHVYGQCSYRLPTCTLCVPIFIVVFTWDRDENCSDRSEVIPPTDRTDYVQTGMKFVWVHIHPALISSRSEHSRLGLEGGITSDRSEQFSSRSHVIIYCKNYYDRNEIAPVWLRTGLMYTGPNFETTENLSSVALLLKISENLLDPKSFKTSRKLPCFKRNQLCS